MPRQAPKIAYKQTSPLDPREWAKKLRAKEYANPGSLLPCQERAWRAALQSDEKRQVESESDREDRLEREGMERF